MYRRKVCNQSLNLIFYWVFGSIGFVCPSSFVMILGLFPNRENLSFFFAEVALTSN
jgi:hypothetical protein